MSLLLDDARIANSFRYGTFLFDSLYDSVEKVKQVTDKEKTSLTLDMPGVDKDSLKIVTENGYLNIEGKRFDSEKVYKYSYSLSSSIDPDKISATIKNGVLKIEFTKKNTSKNIPISD